MKLNPPASSSDLEAAREIARRLHQRRRREDRPVDEEAPPAPAGPRPAPFAPAPSPPARPLAAPSASALEGLPGFDTPTFGAEPPAAPPAAGPADEPDITVEEPAIEEPEVGNVEAEPPAVSPEEMISSPGPPPFEDLPAPKDLAPDASPFDIEIDEDEPREAAAPPSWDHVADACLALAQAGGALLADPAGQVFAARGDWPEPGASAIAAKLVAMMNRTLKDAPTRSISAPLHGLHLTAWRVPLDQGLVTVAFIADAPVRTEARPGIDTEIHRGAGA
jgi:hypothetical protein